jgi:hypothetical protein
MVPVLDGVHQGPPISSNGGATCIRRRVVIGVANCYTAQVGVWDQGDDGIEIKIRQVVQVLSKLRENDRSIGIGDRLGKGLDVYVAYRSTEVELLIAEVDARPFGRTGSVVNGEERPAVAADHLFRADLSCRGELTNSGQLSVGLVFITAGADCGRPA